MKIKTRMRMLRRRLTEDRYHEGLGRMVRIAAVVILLVSGSGWGKDGG